MSKPKQVIRLTSELHQKLNEISLSKCRRVVEIRPWEDMKNVFARISIMMPGVIEMADQIDLNHFKNCPRYELDWSKIPAAKTYDFLLHHEISHCVNDYFVFDLPRDLFLSTDYKVFLIANEVRADRYAWRAIFPRKRMPTRDCNFANMAEVEQFMRINSRYFKPIG